MKGYVTNIGPETMTGEQVVAAYHDLYQVERSFRMTKTDLAARPVFHRLRDSIEAHLTIVFAALAVSREAQARTGFSINKIVKTLRPLRTDSPQRTWLLSAIGSPACRDHGRSSSACAAVYISRSRVP